MGVGSHVGVAIRGARAITRPKSGASMRWQALRVITRVQMARDMCHNLRHQVDVENKPPIQATAKAV